MKFLLSIALIVLCFSSIARGQDWQPWEGSQEYRDFQSEYYTPDEENPDAEEDEKSAREADFELPENCFSKHTSALGAWNQIRLLPVEVVSVRRGVLEFRYRDKAENLGGILELTKASRLPANFLNDHNGKWIVSYCEEHNKIYQIQRPAK